MAISTHRDYINSIFDNEVTKLFICGICHKDLNGDTNEIKLNVSKLNLCSNCYICCKCYKILKDNFGNKREYKNISIPYFIKQYTSDIELLN